MSFITAGQLSFMRSQVLETMPDVGTILTLTNTSDGQGGYTQSWAGTVPTDCRIDFISGSEQQAGGGYSPYTKTKLTLPYNTTITPANRFSVLGNTYNVVSAFVGDRSWNITVRCELEKV
jgi:head-tail adaptor